MTDSQFINYFKEMLTSNVYDVANNTPIENAKKLSNLYGNSIYLKREDMQPNGFMVRGIYNKIRKLEQNQKIVCASIGNLAHAVAFIANMFKQTSVAIIPKMMYVETKALVELGMEVIFQGNTYEEASIYAKKYAEEYKCQFIDVYNDPSIIAGNATIGVEINNSLGANIMKTLHGIFIPVGGGGLLAGIALYIKELYPHVKIFGVGLENSCAMYESLKQNKIISINKTNLFSNAALINIVGSETFNLCKKYVDDIILVTTDEVCAAIKYIYEDTNILVEPTAAMGVAGLIKYLDKNQNIIRSDLVAVISGRKLNFDKLQYISKRANIGNKKEILIKINIPEKFGSLLEFLKYINNEYIRDSVNITQFHYRYNYEKDAQILIGFSTENEIDTESIIQCIGNEYKIEELKNDIFCTYLPYLIHKNINAEEYLFVFSIPERSGSLMDLLKNITSVVNITMFHYRNIGDVYGHILIGLVLINITYSEFINMLNQITSLTYTDETNNVYLKSF